MHIMCVHNQLISSPPLMTLLPDDTAIMEAETALDVYYSSPI